MVKWPFIPDREFYVWILASNWVDRILRSGCIGEIVLIRTVAITSTDWCCDNIHVVFEDDLCWGHQNVGHYNEQQCFPGLLLPGQSLYMYIINCKLYGSQTVFSDTLIKGKCVT